MRIEYFHDYSISPRPAMISENNETLREAVLALLDLSAEINKQDEISGIVRSGLTSMAKSLCRLAFDDPGWPSESDEITANKRTLRSAFNSSGLLQVDVALKLGISPSNLSRSLSEKHPNYCIELTANLCDLLNIEFKDYNQERRLRDKVNQERDDQAESLFQKIISEPEDCVEPVFITNHGSKLASATPLA